MDKQNQMQYLLGQRRYVGLRRSQSAIANVPVVWQVGDIILDQYEVTGKLGEGGMGAVYKVHDRRWNIDLAVKSPRPEIFTREGGKENFTREAETWVRLGVQPHIVHCYYVDILGGIPRIFTEYVDGGSLADWIRSRRLYEWGHLITLLRLLHVAIEFAWGLHFAHEQGLVHQDVKPANVMLTWEGVIKVTDFGLAKARALAGEADTQKAGQSILVSSAGMTLPYCSPEQAARQPLSRKTDIWSWGVSVLEMFVGGVTWIYGAVAQKVLAGYKPQDPAIPVMPAEVMKLLSRCFQFRPEDRPATMLEVATELQTIYAHLLGRPYPHEIPKPTEIDVINLNNQASSLFELGRFEEALALFERAIQLDPTDVYSYYNKGLAFQQLGRLVEALAAFEQAIQLDPADAQAYQNEGDVLQQLGRVTEAEQAYRKARELRGRD